MKNDFSFNNFKFEIAPAAREKVRLKLGVAGPSGSGKTLGSLLVAYGLVKDWSKICLADTENSSGLYYAGQTVRYRSRGTDQSITVGQFGHLNLTPPFDPRMFVSMIEYVESQGYEVLIIDSTTHEWEGKGGCLDMQSDLGGRYQDWKVVTPLHQAFIDAMRNCKMHVIATMRSKQEYSLEESNGRKVVTKLGTKTLQREGTDYEFGIVFDVAINHFASASKDRTGIFSASGPFQLNPVVGETLIEWASSGKAVEVPVPVAPTLKPAQDDAFDADTTYVGTNEQKKMLVEICRDNGIADKADWIRISTAIEGAPLHSLVEAIYATAVKLGIKEAPAVTQAPAPSPTPAPTPTPVPAPKKAPVAAPVAEPEPLVGTVEVLEASTGWNQRTVVQIKSALLKLHKTKVIDEATHNDCLKGLAILAKEAPTQEASVLDCVKAGAYDVLLTPLVKVQVRASAPVVQAKTVTTSPAVPSEEILTDEDLPF